MPFNETLILIIAVVAMIAVTFLSIIPVLPTPLMAWVIAFAAAWATHFQPISLLSVGIITFITLASSLSDFWLPFLGVKTEGGSCAIALGTMVGGLLATFIIPIPLIGTLIGSVAGAILFDAIARQNLKDYRGAAVFATKNFVYGLVIKIVGTVLIAGFFFAALLI